MFPRSLRVVQEMRAARRRRCRRATRRTSAATLKEARLIRDRNEESSRLKFFLGWRPLQPVVIQEPGPHE